ncbi:peptide deformylase [Synechococcus sp. CC9902]|uniref:Peptide deformylase n=1 Tax=Synechococcus sp. (strain CC9902) TaxID=316279 RepID=DEF_SYNS9|nr:peptide deformylase [Synechococcus sp. CC9902]Q3AZU8.1 RecName: Full=Peptide deformylase; Short=PDF; AltName: Full=Polypeptide deformylase [Synechococcus sp. CC9902]ABB25379.1 peptide deformylase [Synechococcus sp. CC9902]
MAGSFAQLARAADKARDTMLVPKTALETPPLEIHTLGADALRQPAQRIGKVNDQVRELARDMLRSMYTAKGIGLAAPQVAVYQQLLVIDLDLENAATPPLVLINPEITAASAGLDTYEEGCLSIPGVYLDVVRPTAIELSYRDEMGRPRKMKADGLMARCIQHEMDHLNGVLFVDRVTDQAGLQKELKENGFQSKHVQSVS